MSQFNARLRALDNEYVAHVCASSTELCAVAQRHGTDKVKSLRHEYTKVMHHFFKPVQASVVYVLEVGVGVDTKTNVKGKCMRAWNEYFSRAEVHGIDNDPVCMFDDEIDGRALRTYLVDQGDGAQLSDFVSRQKRDNILYDLIVDDGSHIARDQKCSLTHLLDLLNPDHGIYMVQSLDPSVIDKTHEIVDDKVDAILRSRGMYAHIFDTRFLNTRVLDDLLLVIHRNVCPVLRPPCAGSLVSISSRHMLDARRPGDLVVMFCCDAENMPGLWACVRSIFQNTKSPDRIKFCVLLDGCTELFRKYASAYVRYREHCPRVGADRTCFDGVDALLRHFDVRDLAQYSLLFSSIDYRSVPKDKMYLANKSNFSRFILPHVFQDIDHALYMDTDIVCNLDVYDVLGLVDERAGLNAASATQYLDYDYAKNMNIQHVLGATCRATDMFNAGVFYWNCKEYREQNMLAQVCSIIERRKTIRYYLGTQPVLNILYFKKVHFLPKEWNITSDRVERYLADCAAGGKTLMTAQFIRHYTGRDKPWNRKRCTLWDAYEVALC